ncbi:MAG: DUF6088 family protein [Clostridiaceae bacterium]|nr:DUF6088 family protein [Clostridiaceae bacterium]
MSRANYLEQVQKAIVSADTGEVYVNSDFSEIAGDVAIRKVLSRLEADGILRRIMRGVYEYPEYNDFLREYVAPSPDKVAHALARNYGWTIVPSGDTALNMFGLSTQVPAMWLYISDGPYKEYTFDSITLKFKHTTNKEISKISYKTALTIQALKSLGKNKITDITVTAIANTLLKQEKSAMLQEAKYATAWIYDIIKQICKMR